MKDECEGPLPEDFEGVFVPRYCPRGRADCTSLSQIISHGHQTFICCGENDGSSRAIEQDRYRVCFKNDQIDDMQDYDRRDVIQTGAVLIQAAAIIEERAVREDLDAQK